ncbi:diguanylate cyclase [Noviherbaspirillum sp. L7-7A]|uniref:GGDEF domain-containing protein n=1 Tax=Noviherbaspirillum sp. L7-7A TaxID=2850560 RepID=UPI001C2C25F8|nr:diguanylate cyclase [Noviherbaspirillum sp. L7-7A]MBV0881254.1 diguanylate cyclase [Noviherbaspirillum sp. L7-7A]
MLKRVLNIQPAAVTLAPVSQADPAPVIGPETVLRLLFEQLRPLLGELSVFAPRLGRALDQADWPLASKTLRDLVEIAAELSSRAPVRRDAIELPPPSSAGEWQAAAAMLLERGMPSLLAADGALVQRARTAAGQVKSASGPQQTEGALQQMASLVDDCAGHGQLAQQKQGLLLDLLRHLSANMAGLAEQQSWAHGQAAAVQALLDNPLSVDMLQAAIANLQDVAARQSRIKESRDQARDSVERMLQSFIASLDTVADSTSQYHARISAYSSELAEVRDADQLRPILAAVQRETATLENHARTVSAQAGAARSELLDAQKRIQALEAKLEEMSELAREDALTQSLNRRGMMEALGREMQRARRYQTPLCVSLLDIDNFKKLNDKLGHQAGDNALVHLVRVIRTTLRQMDVIARFGGEEFMLLLPNTTLPDAVQAVTRIQRELTKSIFMYEHQKVLVTFSAGAALVGIDEGQDQLIQRVDAALYQAKREGKNRVVAAG